MKLLNLLRNVSYKIKVKKKLDPRSYRLYAGKLLKTGFKNKHRVFDAIEELQKKFDEKKLKYNEKSKYNINFKEKIK